MEATLILRVREIYSDILLEMVAWYLPEPVSGCSHNFKYRFYAGLLSGECIVRYDNERRKGDHRHIAGGQEPYNFISLNELQNDFIRDVRLWIKENRP